MLACRDIFDKSFETGGLLRRVAENAQVQQPVPIRTVPPAIMILDANDTSRFDCLPGCGCVLVRLDVNLFGNIGDRCDDLGGRVVT